MTEKKAGWFHFTSDYDHRWPQGAATAFKKGNKVFIKGDVIAAALEAGAGKEISKPKDDDPDKLPTPTSKEGSRRRSNARIFAGNPVLTNGPQNASGRKAGIAITGKNAALAEGAGEPAGGEVTGENLSPASGGDQTEPPESVKADIKA